MDILIVAGLVVIGILLIYIELFLLPGSFFVGILGGIALFVGVYLTYDYFGSSTGNMAFGIALLLLIGSFVLGYRKITSKEWQVGANVEGRVSMAETDKVNVGDKGRTYSVLRPSGKVEINGERIEAFSEGDYIEQDVEVEVIRVEKEQIYVKPVA